MRHRLVFSSALILCVAASTGFAQVRRSAPGVPTLKPVPPVLSSLTLGIDSVSGGGTHNGKVTLSGAAPAGGLQVALTSDNPAVTLPAIIAVPPTATEAAFQVTTTVVSAPTLVRITARAGTATMTKSLMVLLSVVSVVFEGDTPGSTTERIWRITMSGPAPAAGIRVLPHVTGYPHECYPRPVVSAAPIAFGDASGVITMQTGQSMYHAWAWEIRYGGRTWHQQGFSVVPAALVAVDFPTTLGGGTTGYGTVRLNGKTPSADCAINAQYRSAYDREFTVHFSSNSAAVQVPASARVDPLQSERPFSITTSTVQTPQTATITVSRPSTANTGVLVPIKQVTITVTP